MGILDPCVHGAARPPAAAFPRVAGVSARSSCPAVACATVLARDPLTVLPCRHCGKNLGTIVADTFVEVLAIASKEIEHLHAEGAVVEAVKAKMPEYIEDAEVRDRWEQTQEWGRTREEIIDLVDKSRWPYHSKPQNMTI